MSAAEHLREAIDVGCTRDDHDHVADHRAEVLTEGINAALRAPAPDCSRFSSLNDAFQGGKQAAAEAIEALPGAPSSEAVGKDTCSVSQTRAGESTQPAELFERVTLLITTRSSAALALASEATGDSRTDTINRAIQSYALLAGKVAEGGRVLIEDGESAQPAPDLTACIHDLLATFNQTACWDVLRLPQMRQYLAEHLATGLADLARAVEHRDHWHAELMCADARIAELGRKVAQLAPGPCGRALSTGQPCPDHPVVPRTERSYWDTIADALNTAAAAGMPVGIEIDGTLTDYRAWSVIWNRDQEKWEVGGYDDEGLPDGPIAADPDRWLRCSARGCPNGERARVAPERGWTTDGRAGDWLCAGHAPAGGDAG